MKPSLCLNMIVRNESARIERCLNSVLPYCKSVAILDTGSTDDTKEIIELVCAAHDVDCVVSEARFENYSQARNEAFELARRNNTGPRWCQFALLVDADMELRVTDPQALANLDARATAYDMMQKGGAVSYVNRRLVNLDWPKPPYLGVTHEYIDVPANAVISGADFIDHADGANRPDKFPRDAGLLEEALKSDPGNGRYWYYLGNTYRDWGKPFQAITAYEKRISLGGWDEETHSAMMNLACCRKDIGNDDGFVSGMIDAYNFRPRRAEPLFDVAKYYREKGNPSAALMFAKTGVNIKRPDDTLFVNDFVYNYGLRYEYSITGFYDAKERGRAFEVTDDLALDKDCPETYRLNARDNLYHFTKRLADHCPSFKPVRLEFDAPAGYTAMNPSIEEWEGKLLCNIRCVNYRMDEHGRYLINSTNGEANSTNPIDTINFLAKIDTDLKVKSAMEIVWWRSFPKFDLVTGLEDIRLWRHQGQLWFNACVREQSPNGTCQQAIGRLGMEILEPNKTQPITNVRDFQIVSGEARHEKNWMHFTDQRFMYNLNTIIDPVADKIEKFDVNIATQNISGSSQLIEFKAGWLAVVHEAITGPDGKRTYWHRFAWFEHDGRLRRLSIPFVFLDRQIEFCAGLAYHPNHNDLVISFGVRDAEAYLATISIEDVAHMCWKFYEN